MEANTFTGATLDRAGEHRRDDDWVAAQRRHPRARAVIAGRAGVYVAGDRLALVPFEAGDEPILLGLDDEGPVFAVEADGRPQTLLGLREAGAALPHADAGLAAYAAALLNWHRTHRFCANCGNPTVLREAGYVRFCPACEREHHPRTDPVVIMLVTRGDDVLLGRQAAWPPRRYSALAGFVEPGESLEEAVAREVLEESGITFGRPRYVSSQPWPFPMSLMLGFIAPWEAGAPEVVDEELEDTGWFSRAEVAAAAEGDEGWAEGTGDRQGLLLPPRLAIARRLIETWLGENPSHNS
jgi:NAD+ diphosphatase